MSSQLPLDSDSAGAKRASLIADLLRSVARLAERGTTAELERALGAVRSGRSSSGVDKPKIPRAVKKEKTSLADLSEIRTELERTNSREAGMALLEQLSLSRVDLERLAKLQSVHVNKDDSVASIRMKLVESAIGSRLRAGAVRGY